MLVDILGEGIAFESEDNLESSTVSCDGSYCPFCQRQRQRQCQNLNNTFKIQYY
jgi:hypothetical protein